MCNPRKVMIHVAESVAEAWHRAISETVSQKAEVTQLATLTARVELDREMGPAALKMLEQVLAGEFPDHEAWGRNDEGHFTREIDGFSLVFDPRNGIFSLTARLTEMADVEITRGTEICGTTLGEIAFDAVGHYYEDGWSGRTEEKALAEARKQAEIRLQRALYELREKEQEKVLSRERRRLEAEIRRESELELEQKITELRRALRGKLQAELSARRQEAFATLNRAIGEAYRQTLRRLVLDHGGRVISDTRTGTVIDLELEL
ncbi:MAG: hypothetical protein GXO34_07845 [Deltaproteobacteria bacterium]|nr:hypothetical protein [Deltaproteobacteria bacterium]